MTTLFLGRSNEIWLCGNAVTATTTKLIQKEIQIRKVNDGAAEFSFFKNPNDTMRAGIGYVAGHQGDLKKGSLFMTSQFTILLNNPRPFFLLFDEFHLKNNPLGNSKFMRFVVYGKFKFLFMFFSVFAFAFAGRHAALC